MQKAFLLMTLVSVWPIKYNHFPRLNFPTDTIRQTSENLFVTQSHACMYITAL